MATLDYGTSGSAIDPYGDYDWQGIHAFYSEVLLSGDVDIANTALGARAVNAASVAAFVQASLSGGLSGFTELGFNWDIHSNVAFLGQERAYFQLNPYMGEVVSLWDITDLVTWPDQLQLSTPATLGDTKDYVDQNLMFAVDYVLGEIAPAVDYEIQRQLPALLTTALDFEFNGRLDQYATATLYPEVDRRITSALGGAGGGGLTLADVQNEVAVQLPVALNSYAELEIFPAIGPLAKEAVQPDLLLLQNYLTNQYTKAIDDALAQYVPPTTAPTEGQTWSQVELETIAGLVVDAKVPGMITGALVTEVPVMVSDEVTAQLTARLGTDINLAVGESLPGAVTEALPGALAQALPGTLDVMLPGLVDTSVTGALQQALPGAIDAALPQAVGAEITQQLPLAVQQELDARLVPAVSLEVSTQLDMRLATEASTAASAAVAAELETALTTGVLWPLVSAPALQQTRTELAAALPGAVSAELDATLSVAVDQALALTLPAVVDAQLDTALSSRVPALVDTGVADALNAALGVNGALTLAIEAGAQDVVREYFTTDIEPAMDRSIQQKLDATVPGLVSSEVELALGSASLTATVQQEVQAALQPELDQLVVTTVPNVVNLQLEEKLPGMVGSLMFERFGDARIPLFRRYEITQDSSLWAIVHNMGTTDFSARLYNIDGKVMFAQVEPVDETSFVVRLTTAMRGWVDVEFFQ